MGHPLIDEFCRTSGAFSPEFLRRCQRVFRSEVQPLIDERETLLTERAALVTRTAELEAQVEQLKAERRQAKAGGKAKPETVSA